MTQGIFIDGQRPKSKKAIKEALADAALAPRVFAEATANIFHPEANEWDGPIVCAPVGTKVVFVGPDPHRDRRFYGTITVTDKGIKVT